MEMRLRGTPLATIASSLGYENSSAVVADLEKRFKYESSFLSVTGRESLLQLQITRLERILGFAWVGMEEGDVGSMDKGLKAIDMISKHANLYVQDSQTGQQTVLVIGGQEADYVAKLKGVLDGD